MRLTPEGSQLLHEEIRLKQKLNPLSPLSLRLICRFMHAVARVQNTTGPDCFSLKLDPGIGTAHSPPPAPPVPQTPPYGVGTRGGGVTVEFVRSQMDGSFALF